VVDRLRAMRGAGESFSDVILRIAKETTPTKQTKVGR
jgi:predicted CopG family antitoxin